MTPVAHKISAAPTTWPTSVSLRVPNMNACSIRHPTSSGIPDITRTMK
jgi:hypothetical protein